MALFGDRSEDLCCKGCGEKMYGINNPSLRTLCEDCGGNKTEYSAANPHPENYNIRTVRVETTI